jgi:signal transduction histidine kinase/HAMP domain-containing protein
MFLKTYKKLGIFQKLIISVVLIFLPVAVLLFLFIQEKNINIKVTDREIEGVSLIKPLSKIIIELPVLNSLLSEPLKNNSKKNAIELSKAKIDKYFESFIVMKYGKSPDLPENVEISPLIWNWENNKKNIDQNKLLESISSNNNLIFKTKDLLIKTVDNTTLILDQYYATYYLIDLIANHLTDNQYNLDKLNSLLKENKNKLNVAKLYEINSLNTLIISEKKEINFNLRYYFMQNEAVKNKLNDILNKFNTVSGLLIGEVGKQSSPDILLSLSNKTIQTNSELINETADTLENELKIRLNILKEKKYLSLIFVTLFLFLGGSISFFIILENYRTLRLLENATREVANGNLDIRLEADSSIEIALLCQNFNYMVTHLKELMQELKDDIERILEAKKALKASESFNRAVLQAIPHRIAVTNNQGEIIAVNDSWQQFSLENDDDFFKVGVGENYLDICRRSIGPHANYAKEALQGVRSILSGFSDNFSMEFNHYKNKKDQWFLLTSVLLNGEAGGVIITHIDITGRKRMEKELLQSQKLEALGGLAAGIAHDFNNLLTVILGSSNLSLIKLRHKTEIRNELEQIIQASLRASNLTKQLLLFSKKQVTETKLIDLNKLILDLYKMLERIIGEQIEFSTDISHEPSIIKANPGQIEQVIVNMVINARDAMSDKGKLVIETLNTKLNKTNNGSASPGDAEDFAVLKISDNGIGISDEVKKRIFEPYYTTKEVGKGTGLGLATSYGIITAAGGKIDIESEPGKGTTFIIYIPRINIEYEKLDYETSHISLPRGSETILLVEDDNFVLDIISEILQDNGYKVLVANHPDSALSIARQELENIDLIITDMVMPYMTGEEISSLIKVEKPDLKVLFMSGYTENDSLKNKVITGNDFIQKPFSPEDLLVKVNSMLSAKL